jgi:predicted DNA-binding transcriptional regulator AlpA
MTLSATDHAKSAIAIAAKQGTTEVDELPTNSAAVGEPIGWLNIDDVCGLVRARPSWVYGLVRDGRFPPPLRMSARFSRWDKATVYAWIEQQMAATPQQAAVAAIVRKRATTASAASAAKRAARATVAAG